MELRILIFAFLAATAQGSPIMTQQYHIDYEYNQPSDAFYKLHIEARTPQRARQCCQLEDAELMLPKTQRDILQIHAMIKMNPDLGNYVLVASDKNEHDPVDEPAMTHLGPVAEWGTGCEVVRRSGDIATVHCWRQAPFVCKVQAQAAYNHECDVFDKDYISKISTTGSCYKVSTVTVPWNEASAECAAENAHLVVLNSEEEHEVVRDFLSSQLPVELTEIFFFAGIRADRPINGAPRIFRTVQLNQTLDEAGYSEWSENEPNNYQDSEYCGSIYKVDGKYNDLSCSRPHGFICEKEMRAV